MNVDEAFDLLKNAVKESHLENQKHIDLTLVDAAERPKYEKALMIVQSQVAQGFMSQSEVNEKLGLKV